MAVLAGCSASTNEELVATSTPYPIRSPVVAGNDSSPTTEPTVAAALATGRAAQADRRPSDAEAAFGAAIGAAPSNPDAHAGRASARATLGNLDGALDDLNAAVSLAPERADLYVQRAALEERLPDFRAAEEDYDRAIARDPGSAAAAAGRGRVRAITAEGDLVRYQAALDDFNRAVAIDPTYLRGRLGRALVYAERAEFRGDPEDVARALDEIAQLTDAQNEPLVLAAKAQLLATQGDGVAAQRAVAEAVSRLPPDALPGDQAVIEAARAMVALAASDWATAADGAEAALRSDPSRWDAYRTLAAAELGRGDADAAVSAVDRLLAMRPDDGRGLYLQGLASAAQGRVDEARASLEAAGGRLPNSPVYQAKIAEAAQRLPSAAQPSA